MRTAVFQADLSRVGDFLADHVGVGYGRNICGIRFAGEYIVPSQGFCVHLDICPRTYADLAQVRVLLEFVDAGSQQP